MNIVILSGSRLIISHMLVVLILYLLLVDLDQEVEIGFIMYNDIVSFYEWLGIFLKQIPIERSLKTERII